MCLWNVEELDRWIESLQHTIEAPLCSHRKFNWHLTGQAGGASVELRNVHPLRIGGITNGIRYNVYKDLLMTIEKGASVPFADPRIEGIACLDHLLETWLNIARATHLNQDGKARINMRMAFISAKLRIDRALRSTIKTVLGVREEYRVAWHVLLDVATSHTPSEPSQPATLHAFWKVPCPDALGYVRWEYNRYIAPVEYLHAQSLHEVDNVPEILSLSSALFRCLRASLACGHLAETN